MSENKNGGSLPAKIIGYLILLAAALAVVFWFIVLPILEEHGYMRQDLERKAEDLRHKAGDAVGAAGDRIKKITSKTGAAAEKVGEKFENAGEEMERFGEKIERKAEDAIEVVDL